MGGSLDAAGDPAAGYSLRGGRMLTTDNYECTWDLFKTIPSLNIEGQSVFEETVAFNEKHQGAFNGAPRRPLPRESPGDLDGFFHAGPRGVAEARQS